MTARPLRVKLTRDTFIEQIPPALTEKYSFSNIPDKPRKRDKITLTCLTHGPSEKQVQHILTGSGCKHCGVDARAGTNAVPYKKKVQRLLELFPQGLIDLYQIEFGIRDSSLIIQCSMHGEVHMDELSYRRYFIPFQRCPQCYADQPEDRFNPKNLKNDFERYKSSVKKFTEISWISKQIILDPNSVGRSRHLFHLDHMLSIKEGFENNIPPYIVGHWTNLQMMDAASNISKGAKCDHTKKELFAKFQNDYDKNGLYY